MLRIGEFSKLGQVSIKTLRYYDSIGLLVPDSVDPESGYRYYSGGKLAELAHIHRLKCAGFSLEHIRCILHERPDKSELKELLVQQLSFVNKEIARVEAVQKQVHFLLHRLSEKETMPTVEIKSLPEVIVASKRMILPSYDSLYKEAPLMGEAMKKHQAVCRKPAYCFNIYHDQEYKTHDIDIEICEAVEQARQNADGIVYKQIAPVATAACILHKGPYELLSESYSILFEWMESGGYKPVDNCRESYIDGIWNTQDPEQWLTEIQIPVEKQ